MEEKREKKMKNYFMLKRWPPPVVACNRGERAGDVRAVSQDYDTSKSAPSGDGERRRRRKNEQRARRFAKFAFLQLQSADARA